MPAYTVLNSHVHFRQSNLPAQWMTVFASLGIYVHLTGDKRYPYSVQLSESDFLSTVELCKEM